VTGALKMQDKTLQDRTMTDKLAWPDIVGQDNDGCPSLSCPAISVNPSWQPTPAFKKRRLRKDNLLVSGFNEMVMTEKKLLTTPSAVKMFWQQLSHDRPMDGMKLRSSGIRVALERVGKTWTEKLREKQIGRRRGYCKHPSKLSAGGVTCSSIAKRYAYE